MSIEDPVAEAPYVDVPIPTVIAQFGPEIQTTYWVLSVLRQSFDSKDESYSLMGLLVTGLRTVLESGNVSTQPDESMLGLLIARFMEAAQIDDAGN